MAATKTVSLQPPSFHSSSLSIQPSFRPPAPAQMSPRHGVITLSGYGIAARVEKGHLILEDGVGSERRAGRFARVNHGIRRVVVIGNDGSVSLAALRWLSDQDAAFVMLDPRSCGDRPPR